LRVLMVGGTRFIGAHVAKRLSDKGAAVTVFHRGLSENPVLPSVRHVRDPEAAYPVTRFPPVLVDADWDLVVHMVMMGEADAQAAVRAFAGRAGRLVVISSGDVYRAYGRLTRLEPGPPDPLPLTEGAPLRSVLYPHREQEAALGAYVRDYEKILAERVLMDSRGLPWTILRLPKVYGPEDNENLATVYGFAKRPSWRWTHGHVENVAAAIVLAATHPAAANRVYNVGEARTPTMGERLAQLPPRQPVEPPPFDYAQSIVYDTTRIRSELAYEPVLDETAAMIALARDTLSTR